MRRCWQGFIRKTCRWCWRWSRKWLGKWKIILSRCRTITSTFKSYNSMKTLKKINNTKPKWSNSTNNSN